MERASAEGQALRTRRRDRWRTVAACNVGVCLEGFDFIAYGAFAVVLSRLYFPADSVLASTLLTFGGFAAAYLARPFGGIFWGVYADRRGRRAALAGTALLMAIGTGLIAIAPPYAAIGLAAPALVLVARLIQGFAVSGEFASATAMLVEIAPAGRRTSYAATQMATQVLTAGLAAGAVLALTTLLPPQAVDEWGWRLVFGLGTLIGPLGLWMRARMGESPAFVHLADHARTDPHPLRGVVRRFLPELAGMAGLIAASSAALYLILIFLPAFAARDLGLPLADTQRATLAATAAEVVVIVAAARLADRVGALPVLATGLALYTLAMFPLLALLVAHPEAATLLLVQTVAAMLLGIVSAPLPAALSALLPAEVRSTGVGSVYNIVGTIFGGLGPLIVTASIAITGDRTAPGWWAVGTGLIGCIAAFTLLRRAEAQPRISKGETGT